jgi:hypothetical protein
MSLIALANLPYGYYQLLRIVVSGSAMWIAYSFHRHSSIIGAFVFGAIAIIFNPIAKIHMEREVHSVVNVLTALALVIGLLLQQRWGKNL